jgi:hypothetical protein
MKISRRKPAHYFDRPKCVAGSLSFEAVQILNRMHRMLNKVHLGNDRRKARRVWRNLQKRAEMGGTITWRPFSYILA